MKTYSEFLIETDNASIILKKFPIRSDDENIQIVVSKAKHATDHYSVSFMDTDANHSYTSIRFKTEKDAMNYAEKKYKEK